MLSCLTNLLKYKKVKCKLVLIGELIKKTHCLRIRQFNFYKLQLLQKYMIEKIKQKQRKSLYTTRL